MHLYNEGRMMEIGERDTLAEEFSYFTFVSQNNLIDNILRTYCIFYVQSKEKNFGIPKLVKQVN